MRDHLDAGQPAHPPVERTSTLLRELAADGPARVRVGDVVHALRNRAMGLMMVIFGAPCMMPAPPPIPLICSIAVLMVAASLVMGRSELWLPPALARRHISGDGLRAVVRRIIPITERLERWCRPRLLGATSRSGKIVIGLVAGLMAVVVMLPIPVFGNFTPGLAILVTGVGLSERDGAVILLGMALSAFALVFSAGVAWAAVEAVRWAL